MVPATRGIGSVVVVASEERARDEAETVRPTEAGEAEVERQQRVALAGRDWPRRLSAPAPCAALSREAFVEIRAAVGRPGASYLDPLSLFLW